MTRKFIVTPPLDGDITVGGNGRASARLLLGRAGETGPNRPVWFDAAKEFVMLILGKRGSGKSYTLGSILESLAAPAGNSSIASYAGGDRPAVLLLDPMMNFWTTAIPADRNGTRKAQEAFAALEEWGAAQPVPVSHRLWMPAGARLSTDFPGIREFRLRAEDLNASDWADLCGTNLLSEPQGMLLGECWYNVVQEGYDGPLGRVAADPHYTVQGLVDYLDAIDNAGGHDHNRQTVRALRRTLQNFAQPLFSGHGTPLTELLRPGTVSVLMLPPRVDHGLRRVITRRLIRRILREREVARHIQQRLNMQQLNASERQELETAMAVMVPRTILAIDEAQELLGDDGGEAKTALEEFCLQGRNFGLSLILATQRPTTTAISAKVRSQAETHIIHRLLTDDDIDLVRKDMLSSMPEEIRDGDRVLAFQELIRSLDDGQCVITSSNIRSSGSSLGRTFVLNVRPRVCVHGGEAE